MNNEIVKKGLKKIEQYKYLLIVVAAGVILMLLPTFSGSSENKKQEAPASELFSVTEEEARISKALEGAAGIGRTEVILTLKSTEETIYQNNVNDHSSVEADSTSSSFVTETVLISTGSGIQEAVVQKRFYPEYRGALVICEGADKAAIQLKVISAMRALTGLPSDKITVLSKKQ